MREVRDSMGTIALGKRISTLRKENGLTMKDLAEAAGVSVQAVYMWESGQNSVTLLNAVKVAEKLGTTLDYLAGRG